jgi:N-acetyl-gamma-glutamyl-phosphate reductase
VRAGVVGGSGYIGGELLRLLSAHPDIEVVVVQGEASAGRTVAELHPNLRRAYPALRVSAFEPERLEGLDVVFLALGSGRAHRVVPGLLEQVRLVVDLSADFRLRDPDAYPRWYGFEHRAPELLARAAYGLPELARASLAGARLVAAPGCYVTAAALALAPLADAGVVAPDAVVVTALSGVSGAGRAVREDLHYAEVEGGARAYAVVGHRHVPEMEQAIGRPVRFTPHLVPMTRGIVATCHARLSDPTRDGAAVAEALRARFAGERFVALVDEPPTTKDVAGTNEVRLWSAADERTGFAVIVAALDNLVKGGAGQALQAANVALGLDEGAGLEGAGLAP